MNCPVCLDKFTNPVVLPCGHTLCRDACAQRLIRKECLKCPTCRTVHWVPGGERGLPRNYALQEFMETPESNPETPGPSEEAPLCSDHAPTRVSMFCTQCYQLVCLQCCLGPLNGPKPRHFQHEVVPVDTAGDYMQSVVKSAADYIQSRRDEEISRFENLSEANEHFQEMVKRGHSAIHKERKRLKRLLDDRSQLLIGQLHSLESSSRLSDQSQSSLERVLQYSLLAEQCEKIGTDRPEDSSGGPVWKKCEDLGSLLQQIEELPSGPEQPVPQSVLHRGVLPLNTEPLQQAIQTTLTLNIDPPSPPQFSLGDCVFGDTSVSISWTFLPEDKISYFTVYHETAIFVHGMCKDCQSFDVTDFGRVTGQTTIRGLTRDNRYRVFIVARNEVGVSKNSAYLYFRASAGDSDVKLV